MAAEQKPQFTSGNNMYFEGAGIYDQSEYWAMVANNRDTLDAEVKNAATADAVAAVVADPSFMRNVGGLAPSSDLNLLVGTAIHRLSPNGTYLNLPEGYNPEFAGILVVFGADPFTWASQIVYQHGLDPGNWWRMARTTAFVWNPWVNMMGSGGSAGSGLSAVGMGNSMLQQNMSDHYGPISSGGKGAVMLRFDHYLVDFNAKIRGLLEARGLKYALALDSRRWDHVQNAGISKATVNSWVSGGLCEIWNHGTDHEDHTGLDGLTDFIVNSLRELEADLPAAKIWGFMVPGVGGTALDGFGSGSSVEDFTDTIAGQLILKYHAVSSGAFPNTAQRIMDGNVRQGQAHYSIETRTAAQVIAQIDSAIANKKALQLMMHPNRVDSTGGITLADLTTVLDYVKTKIDAGQLANLSPYESMVATP